MLEIEKVVTLIGRKDPIILEIGANNGDHTYQFLQSFPEGSVYAFEPDPRAIRKLKSKNFGDRFHLVEKAVGKETGEITFYQSSGAPPNEEWPEGWDMSGSIKKPKEHLDLYPWCKFESAISVEVVRLDDWRSDNALSKIDFIWADVQGAEGDLIIGAQQTLASTRYFYTEYSNQELYEGGYALEQILSLLPNFEVSELFPNDVLLKNRDLI